MAIDVVVSGVSVKAFANEICQPANRMDVTGSKKPHTIVVRKPLLVLDLSRDVV